MHPSLTLSNIQYVSRVKWSNPGKGVTPSPTPRWGSYRKKSLLVALHCGRQLYFTLQSDLQLNGNFTGSGFAPNVIFDHRNSRFSEDKYEMLIKIIYSISSSKRSNSIIIDGYYNTGKWCVHRSSSIYIYIYIVMKFIQKEKKRERERERERERKRER